MKTLKRLPEAELIVMQAVWNCSQKPIPSAWLTNQFKDQWKTTSILTFLSRLCEKGFLQCEKQGKMNVYTPLITEEEYKTQESVSFLQKFYNGSVKNLVALLSDAGDLTHEDINELREFLDTQGRK